MFSGLVECTAQLQERTIQEDNVHMRFTSPISRELRVDQSVAHHGVCLSVVAREGDTHSVVAVAQTLKCSNLRQWTVGQRVNLERALRLSDRLEGHCVQGHVDAALPCLEVQARQGSWVLRMGLEKKYAPWLIEKGSICLNGVSLTAYAVRATDFCVSIIPHTWEKTTLCEIKADDLVNVEFDLVGKYIVNSLPTAAKV